MHIRHDAVVSRNRRAGTMTAALLALSLLAAGVFPDSLNAQRVITQSTRTINVARGGSALVQTSDAISRISVADPEIADPVLISPREVMINARTVGTTTLLLWDRNERVEMMSIVVTPDIGALQRQIEILFPGTAVNLAASGNAVIVSGNVRDPHTARRLLEVVQASGATVINNLAAPSARQILLHVRFAEVSRTVLNALGSDLRALIAGDLPNEIDLIDIQTLSEGAVNLFLLGDNGSAFEALIRALRTQGHFRSLAEPNLIALEGETATFLAGGEFPFPSIQGGGSSNAVTIQWKEFGVRLNFTPTITNIGTIRLHVTPEVSSLDFANGLTISGFQIPALLTRRAETFVELRPGQHLAIAGLLDNTKLSETTKIPILGDLPILGTFFKSTSTRDRNTELLVLVTPHLVEATDVAPAMPTGETETWGRNRFMRERNLQLPAGVRVVPPSEQQTP